MKIYYSVHFVFTGDVCVNITTFLEMKKCCVQMDEITLTIKEQLDLIQPVVTFIQATFSPITFWGIAETSFLAIMPQISTIS